MKLALFDFDGTITTRDSLFDFGFFCVGYFRFLLRLLFLSPFFLLYFVGIIDPKKIKGMILSVILKSRNYDHYEEKAQRYTTDRLPSVCDYFHVKELEKHKKAGNRIIVVSASPELWVAPWCNENGFEYITTKLHIRDNYYIGIDGNNCNGNEKVLRIKDLVELNDYEVIYAYGNSSGDLPMLALADVKYYNGKNISE